MSPRELQSSTLPPSQGWHVLRAECQQIKTERHQLVATLRHYLAGEDVPSGAVTRCVQQLRINMQDEVSAALDQRSGACHDDMASSETPASCALTLTAKRCSQVAAIITWKCWFMCELVTPLQHARALAAVMPRIWDAVLTGRIIFEGQ